MRLFGGVILPLLLNFATQQTLCGRGAGCERHWTSAARTASEFVIDLPGWLKQTKVDYMLTGSMASNFLGLRALFLRKTKLGA